MTQPPPPDAPDPAETPVRALVSGNGAVAEWDVIPADLGHGRFRIDADGQWYHDGIAITQPRLVALLAPHVARNASGHFVLRWGPHEHALAVADTPAVIRRVGAPGPDGAFPADLVDGRRMDLDAAGLAVGRHHVFYAQMPDGEWVRFNRTAYYQMAQWIHETADGFAVVTTAGQWPIGARRDA